MTLTSSKLRTEHLWLERLAAKLRNDTPPHFKGLFQLLPDWHKFYVPNSLPIAILADRKHKIAVVSESADKQRYEDAGWKAIRFPLSLWNNPERAKKILAVVASR